MPKKFVLTLPLKDDHLWNVHEVAYYLNMTTDEIYNRVARKTLPGARHLGRSLRFNPAKIKQWELQNEVATLEELTK